MAPRPAFDPWLSHLRRDRRGLPVPYVNRWGPELPDHTRIAYDPFVRGDAVFMDDTDAAEPDFTRQSVQRQRECMIDGRCQVCARPVPWSRRHLVISGGMSVEWITLDLPRGGRRTDVPVVFEPWLDARCAEIATQWCPALIRSRRDEKLTVERIRSSREVLLITSTGAVDGHPTTWAQPVTLWAKVALLNVRLVREPPPPLETSP